MSEYEDGRKPSYPRPVEVPNEAQRKKFLVYVKRFYGKPSYSVKRAAESAGMKRKDFRALLEADEDFKAEYDSARGADPDTIRHTLITRALEGVEVPVFDKDGSQVGTKREYSDRLLLELAKATLPEFQDIRRLELTGKDGGPIELEKWEVNVDGLRELAIEIGLAPEPGGALPGPREILPAPAEPEAAALPPARKHP